MRGEGTGPQRHMWSYVPLEQRIPADHPLRPLRAMVDTRPLRQEPRARRRKTSRKGSSLPKAGCNCGGGLDCRPSWHRQGHPSACATRRRPPDPGLDPVRRHAGLN